MKKVEERTTPDLLELTLQLHSRTLNQPNNKEMHEAYVEARQELEKRLPVNEKAVLRSVSGSLPDTRGDKIRKHINPTNHFIDWLIDNGQPQYKVLYDKLEQYKDESYGNDR